MVQAVHEQLRGRIQEHKESRDPEPLTLSVREVGDVLTGSGVPEEKVEAFQDQCRRQYGQDAALNPRNIIEAGKFQITTPEVKITVPPEYSYMVEARIIDGRRFILIPADDGCGGQRHRRHHPQSPGITHGPIRIKMRMGLFFVFLFK